MFGGDENDEEESILSFGVVEGCRITKIAPWELVFSMLFCKFSLYSLCCICRRQRSSSTRIDPSQRSCGGVSREDSEEREKVGEVSKRYGQDGVE